MTCRHVPTRYGYLDRDLSITAFNVIDGVGGGPAADLDELAQRVGAPPPLPGQWWQLVLSDLFLTSVDFLRGHRHDDVSPMGTMRDEVLTRRLFGAAAACLLTPAGTIAHFALCWTDDALHDACMPAVDRALHAGRTLLDYSETPEWRRLHADR
jgi:hypothetical protein